MPKIISTGGETEQDLKQNPLKALLEKFKSLDKFSKTLVITTVLFLVFASAVTKIVLDTRTRADQTVGEGRLSFTCDNRDYVNCLSSQFNIKFEFEANAQITDPDEPDPSSPTLTSTPTPYPVPAPAEIAEFFYKTLSEPLSYQKYYVMFRPIGATIKVGQGDEAGKGPRGAWAMVPKKGVIVFYPRFFSGSQNFKKYVIVHETAHVLAGSPEGKELQKRLYAEVYGSGLDEGCFNEHNILKTYSIKPRLKAAENFAEAVVNTLFCKAGENCNPGRGQAIADFPSTCQHTYNFVRSNVLGISAPTSTSTPTITATPINSGTPSATVTQGPRLQRTPTPTPKPVPEDIVDSPQVATVTMLPTGDSYLRSDYSDRNYGNIVYLRASNGSPKVVSYMKFDLRPIEGYEIRKATLKITQPNLGNPGEIKIKSTNNRWNEKTISYNKRPATGNAIASFVNTDRNKTYDIDLTDWVRKSSGKRASFSIEATGNSMAVFYSKNSSRDNPQIVVEYIESDESYTEE